jgi:sec-independent protein translocase protein TatA
VGLGELIVVLIVVLLVFGANKIPALGDGLGRAIRNFRNAVKGDQPGPKDGGPPPPKG